MWSTEKNQITDTEKKYFPRRTFLREAKTSVFDCHISRKRVESYQTFYFRFLNKKITCIFSLVEFLLLFLRFVVLHFFPSSPGISNFSLAKDVVLQQTPVWPKGVFFLSEVDFRSVTSQSIPVQGSSIFYVLYFYSSDSFNVVLVIVFIPVPCYFFCRSVLYTVVSHLT